MKNYKTIYYAEPDSSGPSFKEVVKRTRELGSVIHNKNNKSQSCWSGDRIIWMNHRNVWMIHSVCAKSFVKVRYDMIHYKRIKFKFLKEGKEKNEEI